MSEEETINTFLPLLKKKSQSWAIRYRQHRDEVESDVLLGALRAIRTYDPQKHDSLVYWIIACAHHAALDGIRLRTGSRKKQRLATFSYDDPFFFKDGKRSAFQEVMTDNKQTDPALPLIKRELLATLLKGCLREERHILTEHFLKGRSFKEAGKDFAVCESRACQISARALSFLRDKGLDYHEFLDLLR